MRGFAVPFADEIACGGIPPDGMLRRERSKRVNGSAAERIARLHLALAGGDSARFADRPQIRAAAAIESRWPGTGEQFAAAYAFGARAARRAVADDGAAGVIFAAAGFPPGFPVHAGALEAAPSARVVYADVSGEAAYLNGTLLAGPRVAAVRASVRYPAELMALPEVRALGGPVQLQIQLCAHFWPAAMCRDIARRYAGLLPAGSTLALSLWCPDGTADGEELTAALSAAAGHPAYAHSPQDVAGWLEGLDLLRPGVAGVRAYRRGWGLRVRSGAGTPGRAVGAVARVP